MVFSSRAVVTMGVLVCAFGLAGCGSSDGKKPGGKSSAGTDTGTRELAPDMAADMTDEHGAGPALSPDDQALADLQKLCPVSGEELGSMGVPVKLIVKGEPVFICCTGCEKKLNADPDKYLAKVAEFKKAKTE
jgi:hypothetical protein